ncbi:MAG: transcriptional regulator [Oscillospiraceae bacterium]|nr:transcriptional regulator [Oscillospiraceae bacterium]
MKNQEIRNEMKARGIKQWQIAEALGIGESTLSRHLRHELTEREKVLVLSIMEQLEQEEWA